LFLYLVFWFFTDFFYIDCRRRLLCCWGTTHVSKNTQKTSGGKKKKYKIKSASTSLEAIPSFLSLGLALFWLCWLAVCSSYFYFAVRFSFLFNVFVNIIATTPITDCLRDFNRFVVKCEI